MIMRWVIVIGLLAIIGLFVFSLVIDEIHKEKIFAKYKVLVWDEEDYIYVVEDREIKKQYMLDNTFLGYRFKESSVNWSDCSDIPYIKERIPGTHRYEKS